MSTRDTLGFVGLGNLGNAMAAALIDAGRTLVVYDMERERSKALSALGATAAASLDELSDCGVVLLAVPDDAAVEMVVDTLLDIVANPCTFVVHSTVLPSTPKRLQERCEERGHDLIDAPVSGGAERARKGDLAIMVGGTARAVRAALPVLDLLASHVWHMGGPGAGAAAKLANQLMMFATLAGVQEALRITDAFNVERQSVLAMTRSSTSSSWVADHWGFFDALATDYDALGTPLEKRPWSKDLWDVLVVGRQLGKHLPVAALLSQVTAERVERAAAAWRSRRPDTGRV